MENDRKKKKSNKKKKNKPATTLTESVTNDGRESTSDTQSHVVEMEQGVEVQISGDTDASNDVARKMDSDTDVHLYNGIEETNLAKADEQYWIEREASFEEKIKQLQAEKDAQMQKEAILEDKIKYLLREKDENLQKLDMLEVRYKQLQREKDAYLQKEISTEVSIAVLSNDSKKLRAQVMELEESRKSLLKEKQELTEKVSSLQLQINNLESTITYSHPNMNNIVTSEDGNADHHQREVMHPPSQKLVPENPELVEKVNGIFADSLPVGSNPMDIAALSAGDNSPSLTQDFALGAEGRNMMPVSHSTRSLEEVMINFKRDGEDVNGEDDSGPPKSSEEIVVADEIVSIPLGENQTEEVHEKNDVSFVDAPLIGAPFRFISFVARYVSGADLVNKNAENSV